MGLADKLSKEFAKVDSIASLEFISPQDIKDDLVVIDEKIESSPGSIPGFSAEPSPPAPT